MKKISIVAILVCICVGFTFSQGCKQTPEFIRKLGFNPSKSALISTERRTMGVVLVEYRDIRNQSLGISRRHVDPSWRSAGFVSTVTLDNRGNAYVLPSAMVNTIHNPAEGQNIIHRIEGGTGKMKPFLKLPSVKPPGKENAFGLMGCHFDCGNGSLLVSSIAGSSADEEIGRVFQVDLKKKAFKVILEGVDVMAVAVRRLGSKRELFYGLARSSQVWKVALEEDGSVKGKPTKVIDLSNLGPQGDEKAKKIKFDRQGRMIITGVPFFYNLTAPVEGQASNFIFVYDKAELRWKLSGIQ